MKVEAMAKKLEQKETIYFWSDVDTLRSSNMKLHTRINSCVNHEAIVDLWKHKIATTLNEVDDEPCNDLLNERLHNCPVANMEIFIPDEVCVFASSLTNNRCPKVDCVPKKAYKYCDEGVYEVLAMFYSSILTHSFVPTS